MPPDDTRLSPQRVLEEIEAVLRRRDSSRNPEKQLRELEALGLDASKADQPDRLVVGSDKHGSLLLCGKQCTESGEQYARDTQKLMSCAREEAVVLMFLAHGLKRWVARPAFLRLSRTLHHHGCKENGHLQHTLVLRVERQNKRTKRSLVTGVDRIVPGTRKRAVKIVDCSTDVICSRAAAVDSLRHIQRGSPRT